MKRFKEFLTEMEKLPSFLTNKFGKYIDMNAKARQRRAANITYIDDKRYNDHKGILWLNVKNKDFYTIAAAVITGMNDRNRIHNVKNLDEILSDKEQLKQFIIDNQDVKHLINKVYNFLNQFMSKGTIEVFRGIILTDKIAELIERDKRVLYNPARLIQYVDNTTKEFNSFSVDPYIARCFVSNASITDSYIVFSAEVDNNDVNWAFTAYLMGRHGSIGESELNINNLKKLKNVKVVTSRISSTAFLGKILNSIKNEIKVAFTYKNRQQTDNALKASNNANIKFHKIDSTNMFDVFNNWRIMLIDYIPDEFLGVDDDEKWRNSIIMSVAYNVKTEQLLYSSNRIYGFGNCIIVNDGVYYSLYMNDNTEQPLHLRSYDFVNITEEDVTNAKNVDKDIVMAVQFQSANKWDLFNCNTGKFITNEKYDKILTVNNIDTVDYSSLLKHVIHITQYPAYCIKDNELAAVYTEADNYAKPIPENILAKYDVYAVCKVKGKNAYVVTRQYIDNIDYVIDENENIIVKNVVDVYSSNNTCLVTINVGKAGAYYYRKKMLNLATLEYISDVEFEEAIIESYLSKYIDKFVVIEKYIDDTDKYNILINNSDGTYKLGLEEWANNAKIHLDGSVEFVYDDETLTFEPEYLNFVNEEGLFAKR